MPRELGDGGTNAPNSLGWTNLRNARCVVIVEGLRQGTREADIRHRDRAAPRDVGVVMANVGLMKRTKSKKQSGPRGLNIQLDSCRGHAAETTSGK